ncbi:hypothetical protein [Leptotrichia alba]|uniref:Uncharacterized protein n=1 Tax=Leptotrichia alba TaxID=3239304 RepID=A0AB39V3Z9_9FUSO
MGIGFYFADAYCLTAERAATRAVTAFYPKKTDISKIDTEGVAKCINADKLKTRKMFKLCNTI